MATETDKCKTCSWFNPPCDCRAKDLAIDEGVARDCQEYDHDSTKDDGTDNVQKDGKWDFDEEVTSVFTNMLSRSIPNYDLMRQLCYRVGRNFIKKGNVVDVGCSNGLSAEMFVQNFNNDFYLCDVSKPMLEECSKKYAEYNNVSVEYNDLRNGIPYANVDLVISCLTIQFTPIEYRQNILSSIYNSLNAGGALLIVEKVIGNSMEIDDILVREYYNIKQDNGYTEELIKNKRKSLEGVLVPLTTSFNENLLAMAGFKRIDCFWRCLNFAAWIAIK